MPDSVASAPIPAPPLVGVFGGTFDPIHQGHLDTVSAVHEACGLDRVLFVPAATPPHRDVPGATAQQRLDIQWSYRAVRFFLRATRSDETLGTTERDFTRVTAEVARFFR